MHDVRAIRADPAAFDAALARRALPPAAAALLALDDARRAALTAFEAQQAERKRASREIGRLKAAGDAAAAGALIAAADATETSTRAAVETAEAALTAAAEVLPNLLDPAVPPGRDESDNLVLHQHGAPADLGFPAKQHFELGEALGLMDFAVATRLSGSRFTVLRGALARLERALGTWMLTLHTDEHGYTETAVPLLVNAATMHGTGQLPKFRADLFETLDGRLLIPTAEVPLTNLVAGEILAEAALPLRFAALTPCFRSEAGSAGRDTRGMLRQHQFAKVELVSITTPEASAAEHERLTTCAERVLTDLGLTWRRILLCAGDTGFAATRTYDLEVWLPGQGAWREISSCSTCGDFQARRMAARYRPAGAKGTAFVHTLNGSGVAVGRALIAVMETFQQSDGGITIPGVLRPFMGGTDIIRPPG